MPSTTGIRVSADKSSGSRATGGITPPSGNNGSPASCVGGPADPPTSGNCVAGDWFPDLTTREVVVGGGVMVKF